MEASHSSAQESLSDIPGASSPDDLAGPAVPLPSVGAIPTYHFQRNSTLTPVVCDERAISGLLELLLSKSGISISEAARRMGVTPSVIRQYLHGRRAKPSLLWFVRLCQACGAEVNVSFRR